MQLIENIIVLNTNNTIDNIRAKIYNLINMNTIKNQSFDEERALYESKNLIVENCKFDGIRDGESAIKESKNIICRSCYFNLRYPMWHVKVLQVFDCDLTQNCRAAIWYSRNIVIDNCKLNGIKALRECKNVKITDTTIDSPEFGWSVENLDIKDSKAKSEYFMLRSKSLKFFNVEFEGKYSFQYTKDVTIENCNFNTKDAFWHSKNVTVKNSVINGEYLGWYSDGLTLENCQIKGTQPLCYCKNLTLINCTMTNCDLSFEKSEVNATILSKIDSIKNPYKGIIKAKDAGEIILSDNKAKAIISIERQ